MRRAIVTGATGLVGSHLVTQLLRGGDYVVTAVGRNEASFAKLDWLLAGQGLSAHPYHRITAQLEEMADCRRVLNEQADVVFHCAAQVSLSGSRGVKAEELVRANVEMTHNLLTALQESSAGSHTLFAHVSSIAALGGNSLNASGMRDEASMMENLAGQSAYGRSKFLAENEVWRAAARGLPVVVVNPAVILGAASPASGLWLNGLLQRLRKGLPFWVDGSAAFVSAGDVARALVVLADAPQAWGERYVLAAENLTYRQFLDHASASMGCRAPRIKVPNWTLALARRFAPGLSTLLNDSPRPYDGSKITQKIPFTYSTWEQTWRDIAAESINI